MITGRVFLGALFLAAAIGSAAMLPLQAQDLSPPGTDRVLADELDAYLGAARDHDRFTGSVVVARGDVPILIAGYGMANHELGVANRADTKFGIASLTKAFTAVSILQLAESGKLDIADGICGFLDRCPAEWKQVTIEHLLAHSSGIPNYTHFPGYRDTASLSATHDDIVSRFVDKPLEFEPGTRYTYSNSGYHLLGMIIESASGSSYGEYLQENIFAPLGMKDSGLNDHKAILEDRASGYDVQDGILVNADLQDLPHLYSEGGIYSTVEDMLRWSLAMAPGRLLGEASIRRMFTPVLGTYGFGWNISSTHGRKDIHHSGMNFGFASHIRRFPEHELTIVVLSNNQATNAAAVSMDLAAIVFGEPYRLARASVELPEQVLMRYVGEYVVSPASSVVVTLENGRLFGQETGQGRTEMFASAEDRFFLRGSGVEIEFLSGPGGDVTTMAMSNNSRRTEASRKIPDNP
jgi:CubicO group peptidase (beta-lactamase class C family)